MPRAYQRATGVAKLDQLAEEMTVNEAATATGRSNRFIAAAIKAGRLKAHGVAGYPGNQGGRGLGWRIRRADLEAWWFGEEKPDAATA